MANVQRSPPPAPKDKWEPGRIMVTRNKKKQKEQEQEEYGSDPAESRREKVSCCSTEKLNDTIQAFREEMKTMNNLLCSIKEEQDARFVKMEKNMTEIKKEVREVRKNSEEVEKAIDYLSVQYEEISRFNKDTIEHRKREESRYNDLVQKNTFLIKCNKALEERIMYIEQKELERNIEIVNVKKQEGENIKEVVKKIANHLKMKTEEIESAWRVPTEKKNSAPIIVALRTKDGKFEWLKARRTMITNKCIYNDNDNTRIYINEHLSRPIRHLLWAVKTKLRDHFKYIWVQNAKILIRKNDDDKKIYQIRSETEIDQYLP